MTVTTLKLQITLSASNDLERALIEHLNERGKRSGLPRQFMLNGFELLLNGGAPTATNKALKEPPTAFNLGKFVDGG